MHGSSVAHGEGLASHGEDPTVVGIISLDAAHRTSRVIRLLLLSRCDLGLSALAAFALATVLVPTASRLVAKTATVVALAFRALLRLAVVHPL